MDIFQWIFDTVHRRKDLDEVNKLRASIQKEIELLRIFKKVRGA